MEPDRLSRLIKQELGMDEETAKETALRILNYFGYSEMAFDSILSRDDRQLFWILEELGILKIHIDHLTLYDGRDWRLCTWVFNDINDTDLLEAASGDEEKEKTVYEEIGWI